MIAETYFLLARAGLDFYKALGLIERGVNQVGMTLTQQLAAVSALYQRYDNAPASLADACLVRMSELYEPCHVLTLDSDFHIYRSHGRKVIPVLCPQALSNRLLNDSEIPRLQRRARVPPLRVCSHA